MSFGKEGITANELMIDNEGVSTIIRCRNKCGEYELTECDRYLFCYDENHDEAYVCPKITRFTDSSMPVCLPRRDTHSSELMDIVCVDNVPTVKPIAIIHMHIESCTDIGSGITSTKVVANGGCRFGACVNFLLNPPANDNPDDAVVKRCWAYDPIGYFDTAGCHERKRVEEELYSSK